MRRLASWTIAFALSASLPACSTEGACCQSCTTPPITITPGTWCITITGSTNNCSSYVIPAPYTATFAQSGSTLTATSSGITYSGTLCGASGVMAASAGGATVSVDVEFSDAGHAAGTSHWATPSCSGADPFTAHAGSCP